MSRACPDPQPGHRFVSFVRACVRACGRGEARREISASERRFDRVVRAKRGKESAGSPRVRVTGVTSVDGVVPAVFDQFTQGFFLRPVVAAVPPRRFYLHNDIPWIDPCPIYTTILPERPSGLPIYTTILPERPSGGRPAEAILPTQRYFDRPPRRFYLHNDILTAHRCDFTYTTIC